MDRWTGMLPPGEGDGRVVPETSRVEVAVALGLALAFVAATRLPLARPEAMDFDEVGYLQTIRAYRFPMHHTLFLAAARVLGQAVGDPYRGFVLLDAMVSALAVVALWWALRAVVGRGTAVAGALALGVGPVFWAYGAMAGNYAAIPLVGGVLLGIALRPPGGWQPVVAAVVLALGAGYRQDIGTFWLPVFAVILWRHRWLAAAQALLLFTALNLAWLLPMLHDAGGWEAWRAASAEFARTAGYQNSIWYLGPIDASLRYAVKATMALAWTLGPGLLFVPRGALRLARRPGGGARLALLGLSVAPALASHLLVHFGVPGYAFHYVPALLLLIAVGIGPPAPAPGAEPPSSLRLLALAGALAAVFLFYPTDYRPGLRGDFDLAFARHTRVGLQTHPPLRDPAPWRTANSQVLPGGRRAEAPRRSLRELWR